MSYETYKVIHIIGILFLFIGLSTIAILSFTKQLGFAQGKMIGFATHGLGLFLMLLSGFGMAARLGLMANLPGWLFGKIAVWVLLGLAISLVKRKPQWIFANLLLIVVLGGTAATLAIFKPF